MRRLGVFFLLGTVILLSGCTNYEDYGKNVIRIDEDGTIEETILDTFEESYYIIDELQSSIEEEVAFYNNNTEWTSETAPVTLTECSIEEQNVTVRMTYAGAEDYEVFNHVGFYQGPIAEFVESQYHAYADLKDTEGNEVPLSSLIASGEEYQVAVMDIDCILEVDGTICYVGEGVEILSKKAADVTLSDEIIYAYVVYK